MKKVEIYTWRFCPFCIRAKSLLDQKKIKYIEYPIDGDEEARSNMRVRANGRNTVPQIFINDQSIGGCDELYEMDQNQGLDKILQK